MLYGHRRGLRIIKLKSFHPKIHGNWSVKLSMTDMQTYMLTCQNLTNNENSFVRFFLDEEHIMSFLDFLKQNDHYSETD